MDSTNLKELYLKTIESCKSHREMVDCSLDFIYKNLLVSPTLIREIIDDFLHNTVDNNDRVALARCLYYKAWTYIDQGEYLIGINELSNSYSISLQVNYIDVLVRTLNSLGFCYTCIGHTDEAFIKYDEALQLATDNDKKDLIPLILGNMGVSFLEIKQYEDALHYSKKVYEMMEGTANRAINIARIGYIYHMMGDNNNGMKYLLQAIEVAEKEKFFALIPDFSFNLGSVYKAMGEKDKATAILQDAIVKSRQTGLPQIEAKALIVLGKIYRESKNYDQAMQSFQKANKIAIKNNAALIEVDSLENIANIYREKEQWKEAYYSLQDYHCRSHQLFNEETSKKIDGIKLSMLTKEAEYYHKLYEQMSTISYIGKEIASSLDLKKIVQITYENINKIMDAYVFGLGLYSEKDQEITYRFFMENGQWVEPFKLNTARGDSFGAWCINNKKEVIINDVAREYYQYIESVATTDPSGKYKSNSIIYVPLKSGDSITGLVSVQSYHRHAYVEHQPELIKALASYISIAMENGRLYEEVQLLANRDFLTGLMNRAHFNTLAEIELTKHERYGIEFCLIMFDLDNFKSINDKYGHDAGDAVLKEIATFCSTRIREVDYFCRYGGEEFLLLLTSTDLDGALLQAERLQGGIKRLNIKLDNGAVINPSASFGITKLKPGDSSIADVVRRADRAMYKSKQKGKDRIETDF